MEHNSRLSDDVYFCMCFYIGFPTQVRIRREVIDTREVVMRPVWIMRGLDRMESGSNREGFRLPTSDVDFMVWLLDHKVISDLSQISHYRIPQHTVILMECKDLPPGFTRLKLMTPSVDPNVMSSSVTYNKETYVSSLLFKNAHRLNSVRSNHAVLTTSMQHGPCQTFNIHGLDIDCAHCFRSHFWPKVALPWIQRCQVKKWPPESVLSTIVKEGCHVVPVGSLPNKEYEWRISFSGAEQKLIYSMNHCQFLCYGLLKIFLKQVINSPCLCSYFMKTIMFWVIQCNNSLHWVPCNLLFCFWTCFKVLLLWVYKGNCPNFFIPQNNMFRVKVVGHTQVSLFEKLHALYNEGISCVLKIPTIDSFLNEMQNRMQTFQINEGRLFSEEFFDADLYKEISLIDGIVANNSKEFVQSIIALEQLCNTSSTSFQRVTRQYLLSELLRNFSCFLSSQKHSRNKKIQYFHDKSLNMMKLAVKIGCVSEIMYLAIHHYRHCHYEQSLECLQRAKTKMSKPYIFMHHFDEEQHRRAMARDRPCDRLRKSLICNITFFSEFAYIDELVPEQLASSVDGFGGLHIPPFVMLHMLFVLNHHRLGDTVRSRQSLQDLHTLMLYDDGTRVPEHLNDISWQILGICQQTCGDYVGALNSFQCSIQEHPSNFIRIASTIRILTILGRLLQIY